MTAWLWGMPDHINYAAELGLGDTEHEIIDLDHE